MKRQGYDREIINRGTGFYEVQCYQCGAWFTSERYDASFCSSTCRSKHARSKQVLQKRIERANNAIDDLLTHLPNTGESKTFNALLDIQNKITKAISNVEMD